MKQYMINVEEEQRNLVLSRFRTLNPDSKILLGDHGEVSVRDIIKHVEQQDDFGKNVIKAQMQMLKILSSV
jgi:hypothetical protein